MLLMKNENLDGNSFTLDGISDKCIILMHGFTATTVEVRPLAEELNQDGYTVICPLLPGHNTSPMDLNTKSWKDWTNCVKDVLEKSFTNYKKVFIGGESMGGLIACYFASHYQKINGVFLYSPALIVPGLNWTRIIRFFKPYINKSSNYKNIENTKKFPWKGYTVNPTKAVYQLLLLQNNVKRRLAKITQPIIIFQGIKDYTVNPLGAQHIFNKVQSKNKQLIFMENSGHCIVLDREFETVVDKTKLFLNSID